MSSVFDPSKMSELASLSDGDAYALCTELELTVRSFANAQARRAIGQSLPARIADLAPETQRLLADIAWSLRDVSPRLPCDAHEQSREVRAAWLRVQLAQNAAPWPDAPPLAWCDALDSMRADGLAHPLEVVAHCSAAGHERLQRTGIRLAADLLDQGIANASFVVAQLERLLQAAACEVRAAAAALLSHPVLRLSAPDDCARLAIAAMQDDDLVAECALGALPDASACNVLMDVVGSERRSDALRAAAAGALGRCMMFGDLDTFLRTACSDPVTLAEPARRGLLAAHMRGVFPKAAHLPSLLELFESTPAWTAAEFVRITHTERFALVTLFESVSADDLRWCRLAEVLALIDEPRTATLLAERLRGATRCDIAEALIAAAAHCPGFEDESALLDWLERLPRHVLSTLRVKGGRLAEAALLASVRAPYGLGSLRGEAGFCYYALAEDKIEAYEELRYAPQSSSLTARLRALSPPVCDEWSPGTGVDGLALLSLHGDARHLTIAMGLFRSELARCFEEQRTSSARSVRDRADGATPTERDIETLCAHLTAFGERLISRGAPIYSFAVAGPLRGDDLLQRALLDWLEEQPVPEAASLLELLSKLPIREPNLRRLAPWWRARDPAVRAAAVRAILAAGEAGAGFAFSLTKLAEEADHRVRRQALIAIEQYRIFGAESVARDALSDRNMNVRRAAACALAHVGTEDTISALVAILAHHDNAGFRHDCLRALEHCAKGATTAVLLAALDAARDRSSMALLLDAVARRLTAAQVVRLCHPEQAAAEVVLGALDDGSTFSGEIVAEVNLHLDRCPAVGSDAAIEQALARLRVRGFTKEAALELCLATSRHQHALGSVASRIRDCLHDWARWAAQADGDHALIARRLALDAAAGTPSHGGRDTFDALMEIAVRTAKEQPSDVLRWCTSVAKQVPDAQRLRFVSILRALLLPASSDGLPLFRALVAGGALLAEHDLERCLEACPTQHQSTLLAEAFQVEGGGRTEVARWSDTFSRRPPESASEWLGWANSYHLAPSIERRASLRHALEARPLGLSAERPVAQSTRPRTLKRERVERRREELLAAGSEARTRAALEILSDPAALHQIGASVLLRAFLAGQVSVPSAARPLLAQHLRDWPSDTTEAERACQLLPHLPPGHARRWIPEQLDAWAHASESARVFLDAANRNDVVDFAARRVEHGEHTFDELLSAEEKAQSLFASEGKANLQGHESHAERDPLDSLSLAELRERASKSRGDAAVLFVKELIRRGPASERLLLDLTTHAEWRVRNACLRGISQVSQRELYLSAAASMFATESSAAPLRRLARIVAHGRVPEAVPKLIDLLVTSNPSQRVLAHEALVAYGPMVIPALRKALRHARPDHKPRIVDLLDVLGQTPG